MRWRVIRTQLAGLNCSAVLCGALLLLPNLNTTAAAIELGNSPRPRIGLVLSGGGARGAAHIGVLKVLEQLRIPIDVIVGTSMGALVGGSYAAGLSAAELEQRVTTVDWNALFNDDPPRAEWSMRRKELSANPTWNFSIGVHNGQLQLPKGAIAGQKVQLFFSELVQRVETITDFNQLPIPFRAVATDLEHGTMAVFDRGPLPIAMRASMAVPGVFAPIIWQERVYVDGGLVRNLPIDVARELGADIIIAVNVGSGYLPRTQLDSIVGITGQIIAMLTVQNAQASLQQLNNQRDVLIEPDLTAIGSSDFGKADVAIAAGMKAAQQLTPVLMRLSRPAAEYAAWQRARLNRGHAVQQVAAVQMNNTLQWVNPQVFNALIATQQPTLQRAELKTAIQQVYGRGDFERISYHFVRPPHGSGDVLMVDAIEKAWGPGYLRFGLGLSSDNQGDSRFGLRTTYHRTWLNAYGAEWWTELTVGNAPMLYSEIYQPLQLEQNHFIAAYFHSELHPDSLFVNQQRVARYDVTRTRLGIDIGTIWQQLEWRVGAYYGTTDMQLDTGTAQLPERETTDSSIRTRIRYDTLDSPAVPRSGTQFLLETTTPITALGADQQVHGQYTRALLNMTSATSWGAHTLATTITAGSSFGAALPYEDQFTFGGFLHGSGYANAQFRSNDIAAATLAYYHQIASLPPPFGRGLYVGASLEIGWLGDGLATDHRTQTQFVLHESATRSGGSLFLGSDTWIGPAYLGIGIADSGDHALYILLGRP